MMSTIFLAVGLTIAIYMEPAQATEPDCMLGNEQARLVCAMNAADARAGTGKLSPRTKLHYLANRLGFGMSTLDWSRLPLNQLDALSPKSANAHLAAAIVEQLDLVRTGTVRHVGSGSTEFSFFNLPEAQAVALLAEYNRRREEAYTAGGGSDPIFLKYRAAALGMVAGYPETMEQYRKLLDAALSSVQANGNVRVDQHLNLPEYLEEFWFNHFNIDTRKASFSSIGYHDMIVRNQGKTFYNLLLSVMSHPGMLVYLDNHANKIYENAPDSFVASNQNLGRELLELHTLGVGPRSSTSNFDSPYDQTGVEEAAKAIAGWGVARTSVGHRFRFNQAYHNQAKNSSVSVLLAESPITGVGINKGVALLRRLAQHPRTKINICRKLAFYLGGTPPMKYSSDRTLSGESVEPTDLLVRRCIAAWGLEGDLPNMYMAILSSPAFYSPNRHRSELKTPVELVISLVRQRGVTLEEAAKPVPRRTALAIEDNPLANTSGIVQQMIKSISLLGLPYRRYGFPTGYPMPRRRWMGPAYQIQAARVSDLLVGEMQALTIGTDLAGGLGTGNYNSYAAHEAFSILVDNHSKSEINIVFAQQILNVGSKSVSPAIVQNLYPLEDLRNRSVTNGPMDVVRAPSGNFASPLRTLVHRYLNTADFLLK